MKPHRAASLLFALSVALGIAWMIGHYWGNAAEGDTGCFGAVAHQMRAGAVLYQSVFDNKGPGIFYIHAGFQWLTQQFPGDFLFTHYASILQITFFLLFYASFSALAFKQIQNSTSPYANAFFWIFTNFSILNILAFWPAFFAGGYTEEIGSYLLFGAISLMLLNHPNTITVAGIFIGTSLLVKEPFILFLPAIFLLFQPLNKQAKINFTFGLVFPWVFQAAYLTITHSWGDYFHYLKFASAYANANPLPWNQKLAQGLQNANLWNMNTGINLAIFVGLTALTLKNKLPNTQTLVLPLIILLAAFAFGLLGSQHYQHYDIPLLFATTLLISFIYPQIEVNISARNLHIIALLTAGNFLYPAIKKQTHFQIPYPLQAKSNQELKQLHRITKTLYQQPIYIDEQSSGRFYLYLNSTYKTAYPCAYYTYFLPQDNPQNQPNITAANNQIQLHQNKFSQAFTATPPKYLLTLKNLSPAFWCNNLGDFVNQHYRITDSCKIAQNTFYVRTLKPQQ